MCRQINRSQKEENKISALVTIIPTEGATDRPKKVVVPTPAYMLELERPHFLVLVLVDFLDAVNEGIANRRQTGYCETH